MSAPIALAARTLAKDSYCSRAVTAASIRKRIAWPESYQNGYYSIPASERGAGKYGSKPSSGSTNYGGKSIEYKRGYNDAMKGYAFDQNRHPQDYKDGYRAGEASR
jgi:hypothetical protein